MFAPNRNNPVTVKVIKISTLRFHPGGRERWLESQHLWNRAKHRHAGFYGADILLSRDDPTEAATYARWESREVEQAFMNGAGKRCYEESEVKSLLAGEEWDYYHFDHPSRDRQSADRLWIPAKQESPAAEAKVLVKLLSLRIRPGMIDRWFEKQPFWNRAMMDGAGFIGGDILRGMEDRDRVLLCTHWTSRRALDLFMKGGAAEMMEKTGVGDLILHETGRIYDLDHHSFERR